MVTGQPGSQCQKEAEMRVMIPKAGEETKICRVRCFSFFLWVPQVVPMGDRSSSGRTVGEHLLLHLGTCQELQTVLAFRFSLAGGQAADMLSKVIWRCSQSLRKGVCREHHAHPWQSARQRNQGNGGRSQRPQQLGVLGWKRLWQAHKGNQQCRQELSLSHPWVILRNGQQPT